MTIRHALAVALVGSALAGPFGCKARDDRRAQALQNVDPKLTYPAVAREIDKHVGQKVAWEGIVLGYHSVVKDGKSASSEYYTYLPPDDRSGGVDFDKPFMFHRAAGEDFRTEAARQADAEGKDHRRLVIGTIAGSEEFKYQEGKAEKTLKAPLLKDVIIDLPAEP